MLRKGITYILLATLAFSIMNVMAKELSALHPMQVVFFRAFGTFSFIFPYMLWHGISIRGKNPGWLLLRGFVGTISLATFFFAIQRVPLGSAISIRYLGPIFAAFLAFYFLKEKINRWQWLSFLVAFTGAVILKGFDVRIDTFSLILLLISALLVGVVFVLIRYLATREHFLTIINFFMLFSMVAGLLFLEYWRMPIGREWFSIIGIGIFGMIGQVYMTRAYQTEETSILAPFKYMELVWALVMGFFLFGEFYTLIPMLGITLIVIGMVSNVWAKRY